MSSAYLLVSHGSRDPRPDVAIQQLGILLSHKLTKGENLVGVATLECNTQPLHQQIQDFAQKSLFFGCQRLKIIPLFLLPGVHVMSDIPVEVELAEKALGGSIQIQVTPYLGSNGRLEKLLTQIMDMMTAERVILLAHGSRRPGSLQPIEIMAEKLGAVAAYWSVAPSLEEKVTELIMAGEQDIAILPYFLFPGGISDAIAECVEKLQLRFPGVKLKLAAPLGVSAEMADVIWDLATQGEKFLG